MHTTSLNVQVQLMAFWIITFRGYLIYFFSFIFLFANLLRIGFTCSVYEIVSDLCTLQAYF